MASGRDNAASGGTGNVIADQDNDNDNDNDSVTDDKDNCPAMANPDQLDTDADLLCDVCDAGDGIDDVVDVLPLDQ